MIGFVNQFLNLISMHHKLHNIVHTVSSSMHTLHSVAMVPSRAHILQEGLGVDFPFFPANYFPAGNFSLRLIPAGKQGKNSLQEILKILYKYTI